MSQKQTKLLLAVGAAMWLATMMASLLASSVGLWNAYGHYKMLKEREEAVRSIQEMFSESSHKI